MAEEQLTDMERLLVVTLLTMQWVRIRDDKDMEPHVAELKSIIRKMSGVDKQVIVRAP